MVRIRIIAVLVFGFLLSSGGHGHDPSPPQADTAILQSPSAFPKTVVDATALERLGVFVGRADPAQIEEILRIINNLPPPGKAASNPGRGFDPGGGGGFSPGSGFFPDKK